MTPLSCHHPLCEEPANYRWNSKISDENRTYTSRSYRACFAHATMWVKEQGGHMTKLARRNEN